MACMYHRSPAYTEESLILRVILSRGNIADVSTLSDADRKATKIGEACALAGEIGTCITGDSLAAGYSYRIRGSRYA